MGVAASKARTRWPLMETVIRAGKRFIYFSVIVRSERPLSTSSSVSLKETNNQTTSGQGFPEAGLEAGNAGDLTKANKPTTANSIGRDVE